ncbi:hypothetical protein [Pedobacter sp. V48]|uniref:hypothetical protein n=1 Tax=Pedobacter sp. V48 TaxID=509635 RepID=UPI001267FF8A|nr:hypothetical protein [Pedobacter sp. V48]
MNKYIRLRPRSKSKVIWTLVLSSIILFCIYIGVFQLHYYNKESVASMLLLVVGNCFIILQMIWLETSNLLVRTLCGFLLLVAVRFSALGVLQLQKRYYVQQLENHGKIVDGKVLLVWSSESSLFYNHYMVVRYALNNENFIQKIDDENQRFNEGDNLKLRISAEHPGILQVMQ